MIKNKWIVLAASVLIQTILGGVYAWSTFVPSLIGTYGLNNAQSSFIFGVTIALFTLSMTLAGRILITKGPRMTATLSGILYLSGYLIASVSGGRFILLLVSIGLLSGSGIGFGYVGPLSVGMKWFPDKKGLITGVAVAGFGGGAVVLSSVARIFLSSGTDVLVFFRWMGILLGALLLVTAQFMANPPQVQKSDSSTDRNTFRNIRTPQFILFTFGLFSGTFAGLLVIGNLVPIVTESGLTAAAATAAVSVFAVGNAAGRITWGHIFDRFGYRSIPVSLLLFAGFLVLLILPLPVWMVLLTSAMLGFGFGSCFVVYASAVSNYFGVNAFATLYPICFLGYGAAGIFGPVIGGQLADLTGSFTVSLYIGTALLIMSGLILQAGIRVFLKQAVKAAS